MKEISFTEEDRKILSDLGVSALVLFGSHAQGLAGHLSDFDTFLSSVKNVLANPEQFDMSIE